jgi:hypothetical protein
MTEVKMDAEMLAFASDVAALRASGWGWPNLANQVLLERVLMSG